MKTNGIYICIYIFQVAMFLKTGVYIYIYIYIYIYVYIYGALFENTCTSARDKMFFTILNHVTKRQTPSLDKDSAKESKTCGLHNFWIL